MKARTYIIVLIGLIAAPTWAAETHCCPQEQIVFSCSLGEKMVSVCASKDFSPNGGYLQYRFGSKQKPDQVFPNLTASILTVQYVQARSLLFAGGGGAYLRFLDGNLHYIVYTAVGKGWGIKDGVAIEKNGQLISNLECQDIPVATLNETFFTQAGLLTDQSEFQIPGID